jgi:hypothetical protein
MEHIMNKQTSPSKADAGDRGLTPERIRTFLLTLAECGCVTRAAEAAGVGVAGTYRLRKRSAGGAFHLAWEAALQIARRRLANRRNASSIPGSAESCRREAGEIADRDRFDRATFTRLVHRPMPRGKEAGAVRAVVQDFETFVRIASYNGAGLAATASLTELVECLERGGVALSLPCYDGDEWLIWTPPPLRGQRVPPVRQGTKTETCIKS